MPIIYFFFVSISFRSSSYTKAAGRLARISECDLLIATGFADDPYAHLHWRPENDTMPRVLLKSWHTGMLAIPVIAAIRQHTGLGLADAKHAIDAFLEGEQVVFLCPTPAAAHALIRALADLHITAELLPDP